MPGAKIWKRSVWNDNLVSTNFLQKGPKARQDPEEFRKEGIKRNAGQTSRTGIRERRQTFARKKTKTPIKLVPVSFRKVSKTLEWKPQGGSKGGYEIATERFLKREVVEGKKWSQDRLLPEATDLEEYGGKALTKSIGLVSTSLGESLFDAFLFLLNTGEGEQQVCFPFIMQPRF
jgi:hypothetical protein